MPLQVPATTLEADWDLPLHPYHATGHAKAHDWKQEFWPKIKAYSFSAHGREMSIEYVKSVVAT